MDFWFHYLLFALNDIPLHVLEQLKPALQFIYLFSLLLSRHQIHIQFLLLKLPQQLLSALPVVSLPTILSNKILRLLLDIPFLALPNQLLQLRRNLLRCKLVILLNLNLKLNVLPQLMGPRLIWGTRTSSLVFLVFLWESWQTVKFAAPFRLKWQIQVSGLPSLGVVLDAGLALVISNVALEICHLRIDYYFFALYHWNRP